MAIVLASIIASLVAVMLLASWLTDVFAKQGRPQEAALQRHFLASDPR